MKVNKKYYHAARNALEIWKNGACNPVAIMGVAHEAAKLCRVLSCTTEIKHQYWAPVRLILAQLSFLAGTGIGDYYGVEGDITFVEALELDAAGVLDKDPRVTVHPDRYSGRVLIGRTYFDWHKDVDDEIVIEGSDEAKIRVGDIISEEIISAAVAEIELTLTNLEEAS